MGIAEQLNVLRRDHPACRVATFTDIASGLVLFSSADRRLPQERLDALSRRARELLRGSAHAAATGVLGGPVTEAVVTESDGLLVVVRSPTEPDEALICDCAEEIDLAAFTEGAARALSTFGAAG